LAVRLRKLARELDRSPEEVLETLKSIGFDRFRSGDDMLSDAIADRVRKTRLVARRTGAAIPAPTPPPALARDAEADDLMSQLVPGVVRQKAGASRVLPRLAALAPHLAFQEPRLEPQPEPETEPETEPESEPESEPEPEPAAEPGREEPEALTATAAALADREAALAEREGELRAREERQEEREAGFTMQGSLLSLLEERGLRGLDEAERAVAALAGVHAFGRVLGQLVPADPEWVRRLLADRLVLVGPGTEGLGPPMVTVSEDRADLPGGERLTRAIRAIGDNALLDGRRRILFTGIPPRWQPLVLSAMDRRVEATFRPGGVRDAAAATEDVKHFDLAVLWNTELTSGAREVWAGARSRLLEIEAETFGEWLQRVPALLSSP